MGWSACELFRSEMEVAYGNQVADGDGDGNDDDDQGQTGNGETQLVFVDDVDDHLVVLVEGTQA